MTSECRRVRCFCGRGLDHRSVHPRVLKALQVAELEAPSRVTGAPRQATMSPPLARSTPRLWLATDATMAPPDGALVVRTSQTRAVVVALDRAVQGLGHDAVSVRRFYRKHDVFDCEAQDAAQTPPGATATYRHPAIAAFDDGRLVIAWVEDFALPGEPSAPHIRLRFLAW